AAAGPAVAAEPVSHTRLLTVLDTLERRGPDAYGSAEADLPLLLDWFGAFSRETGQPGGPSETGLRDRLSYGGVLLRERAGRPVAMAGFFRVIGSAARVGPVYTPPGLRGRGYAAGVTHAVSEAAYAAGAAEVLLFTDPADATGNGVHRRLGYAPVEDRVEVAAV
ncbi:GNAT family N-acetyltransferase, partial [Streptomyces sp. SID7760]|nr:GNAT family N-acetyltransferase [Streptomyces sp. SID7760]